MGYFPFFMELSGQEGLIVGGGVVALRKIEKLLPFGAHLTVVAPQIDPAIRAIEGLTLLCGPFSPAMLTDPLFVIAATDDHALNHRVAAACRERRIPVNVVDDRAACTFLFPALVHRGDLSVGISTGGASPSAAIYLKERIGALIPENFSQVLSYLDTLRGHVKAAIPDERCRAAFFSQLLDACMERGRPLTAAELCELERGFTKEDAK